MKELYESCRKIILDNYSGCLDEETLDVLSVAVLSLYIKDAKLAGERIPNILKKLDIQFGPKKVSDLVLEKYDNYPWDEGMHSESAMVVRALDSDSSPVDEEWTMLISTLFANRNITGLLSKSVHELVYLLRFGGIVESESELRIRDGISVSRYNKTTKTIKRKHYYFEEGIVELYTKDVIDGLFEQIKDEDVSFSPTLTSFKATFFGDYKCAYPLQSSLIEALSVNSKFKELVGETFYATEDIPPLINYYNSILGSPMAFTSLSRGLDNLAEALEKKDMDGTKNIINSLRPTINKFVESGRRY